MCKQLVVLLPGLRCNNRSDTRRCGTFPPQRFFFSGLKHLSVCRFRFLTWGPLSSVHLLSLRCRSENSLHCICSTCCPWMRTLSGVVVRGKRSVGLFSRYDGFSHDEQRFLFLQWSLSDMLFFACRYLSFATSVVVGLCLFCEEETDS